ncbi:hypothetical protein D3C85_1892120 [compost metagenome]
MLVHSGHNYGHIIDNVAFMIAHNGLQQRIGDFLRIIAADLLNDPLHPHFFIGRMARRIIDPVRHHD